MAEEITRREQFYAAILGEGQIPEPKTREEQYLQRIAQNGGGGGGTTNYNDLNNKPQINSVTLQGDQSISDLFDGKVDIGVGTVEESGYAELKDENGDRIFRAGSANGGAAIESGALIGQSGALVLYNGEGGLGSVCPKGGASLVEVDLPAESGTLALDSQIASSQTPAKASVVTVPDAAPINAEDITVDITPIQDLHGYDRPWAGGAGKNKATDVFSDFTNPDNYYICPITLQVGRTYTIYATKTGQTVTNAIYGFVRDGDRYSNFVGQRNVINIEGSVSNLTFTVDDTFVSPKLVFYGNESKFNSIFANYQIQLEESNQATPYAPYSNICPIEGWTGAELDRVGINQWDEEWEVGDINSTTGENESSSTNIRSKNYIQVKPNNSYYFFAPNQIKIRYYGRNKNYIAGGVINNNAVIMMSEQTCYIRFAMPNAYGTTYNHDISINYPSTDTEYHPYQGQQYTASFGETVYGGKWHVTAGGTDKTLKNVEYSDNTGIERNNGTQYFCDVSTLGVPMGYLLSNKFKPITDVSEQSNPGVCYINTDGKIRFNTAKSYDSVTEMIADIGAIQFSYELATPTTISTPKQNVPMLKGINTVSADCGDTQLKYQPDNVIGELKGMIQALDARATALEEA